MFWFRSYYITCGLFLIIAILLFNYCRKLFKKYEAYSVLHIIPYILYNQLFRKIPKNTPLTSFAFQVLIDSCKQHMKEGVCFTYLTKPTLLIFSEESVKFFSNEKAAVGKPDMLYLIVKDILGAGLVTSSGEKWKKHRKMMNPAFSLGILKDKIPLFNNHALALVNDLEILVGKPSVDLTDYIKSHYFNALSESVFGFKQTEKNRAENLRYFHLLDNAAKSTTFRFAYPWLQWKFMLYTFSYGRQILREYEELLRFTKSAILRMKEYITSNQVKDTEYFSKNLQKSLSYILLQFHFNDPSFTFEDLLGEVTTFMAGGFDTVSYSTMWCLFMLGLHPEVQEKAYNEVQFVARETYISFDDCNNFTYLEAVILETLRLYPTIPLYARQLNQDVQCGKYKVPKDTVIGLFPYVLHRNPEIYPDPEKFDPERFLENRQQSPYSHIPFSEGQRNCIGKKYALIEMKIFLAYFLRKYKVTSLDKREDIRLNWHIVLSPCNPLRMHIERR